MLRYPLALALFPAMFSLPAHSELPTFDSASLCPNAEAERAPNQRYLRTCVVSSEGQDNLIVERFTATGLLDPIWGTGGRAQLAIENDTSCHTGHAGSGVYFPPDGRTLVIPPGASRLIAFGADGTFDVSYGNHGLSARICDQNVNTALLSLDMLADGRLVAISWSTFTFHGEVRYCVAYRLLANGNADPAFADSSNIAGRIGYGSVPCSDNTVAWALQEDNSLQATFFGQPDNTTTPILYVYGQGPTPGSVAIVPNRALPRRGVVFHFGNAGSRFRYRDGSIHAIEPGIGQMTTILPTGRIMFQSFNYEVSTRVSSRTFLRAMPSGELDTSFGTGGVTRVSFPAAPENCTLALGQESVFLQPDGSTIYTGRYYYYYANTGWAHVRCPAPSGSKFAVKLLADGKLDPSFPQWKDPAVSGAIFAMESPKWTAVEYYSPKLDRYFFTPHPLEADAIDRDITLRAQGWWRTGKSFGVWNPDAELPGTASACRFAADPIVPPKSFYDSILDEECNILREQELATPPGQRAWRYDRESFRATPPTNGACPSTLIPIYSLYNQGHERGIDSNFRYVDNLTDFNLMIDRGWVGLAKPQFCARPD
ncbi:MAG: hypothetical protein JNN20_10200 [Betaproteobacteria bacterium]|nr:hypothetical protein [Betaproteobacteria bacterium]